MTAPDLAAVCRAHGIDLRWNGVCYQADLLAPHVVGGIADKAVGKTEADAIAALLRSQWDMHVVPSPTRQEPDRWRASCEAIGPDWVGTMDAYGPSHTAAVLALADRLRGAE